MTKALLKGKGGARTAAPPSSVPLSGVQASDVTPAASHYHLKVLQMPSPV